MMRMRAFFEFLNKKGLSQHKLEKRIQKWDSVEAIDFVTECRELLPRVKGKGSSLFDFVANLQLSGGPRPCGGLECRIGHADKLARFAALYADRVLIRNPFETYVGLAHADEFAMLRIANDLHVLHYLRPLLEAGLLGFSASKFHFCATCYERHIRGKYKVFEDRLSKAKTFLEQKYLRETQFFFRREHDVSIVDHVGPEELIDHSHIIVLKETPQILERYVGARKPHRLTRSELTKSGILEHRVLPIINDIAVQNWYSSEYGCHYVTDREIDFDLISMVNDSETELYNRAFMGALSHSVPFIDDVELSKLVEFRDKEGESFRVYRDAVARTIKSVTTPDAKRIRQSFDDLIRPELNRIDLAVKNSKKLLWGSLKREVLFATGLVTIGLYGGLLPPNIGAIVAALGGFKFASGVADKAIRLLQEPTDIRDNKYYFLWKVRKKSYGKR